MGHIGALTSGDPAGTPFADKVPLVGINFHQRADLQADAIALSGSHNFENAFGD
jgi:hypothetical protein